MSYIPQQPPPSLPPSPPAIVERAENINTLSEQLGDIVSFGEAAKNKLEQDDEMEAAAETSPEAGQGPPPDEDEEVSTEENENWNHELETNKDWQLGTDIPNAMEDTYKENDYENDPYEFYGIY